MKQQRLSLSQALDFFSEKPACFIFFTENQDPSVWEGFPTIDTAYQHMIITPDINTIEWRNDTRDYLTVSKAQYIDIETQPEDTGEVFTVYYGNEEPFRKIVFITNKIFDRRG